MVLNENLTNEQCIGKNVAVSPNDYDESKNDGYYDVYDSTGRIIYMYGESVQIVSYDEQNQTVTMYNDCNEDTANFTISYNQYLNHFGTVQTIFEV